MKNVLHLVKEYRGNYPLFNETVRALPNEQFRSIVCFLSGKPDGNNELETIASEVLYLQFSKKALRHLNPRVILSLSGIMRAQKIDIVHCHRHKATVFGAAAAALAGVPKVLSTVHGTGRTRSLKRKISVWLLSKMVSKFIGVSEGVKEDLLASNWGMSQDKVVAVPNGLDYRPLSLSMSKREARGTIGERLDDKVLFGIIGRLSPKKNHDRLIAALSIAVRQRPDIHLVIVGRGPLHELLLQKTKDIEFNEYVTFTGYRSDVPVILKALDSFILPSLPGEGLPLALLEAMGAGLPVIASRIPGVIEVFERADIGRLVDPMHTEEIADAIVWFAGLNEAKRSELGENAKRQACSKYSAERMAEGIRGVYSSLE